jgi:hypothetical protein
MTKHAPFRFSNNVLSERKEVVDATLSSRVAEPSSDRGTCVEPQRSQILDYPFKPNLCTGIYQVAPA